MGTVLSFSPRERRPVYSTHHHSHHHHHHHHHNGIGSGGGSGGTGSLSSSNSADFPLNNFSYEQLNNAKNRENTKPICQQLPNNNNGNMVLLGQTHNNHANTINNNNNNGNSTSDRSSDSARILSEKNALEKNLKKHSLFINALSWKRLAASHGKKKMDNNKNKAANLPTANYRAPLVDATHPLVVDKNKNIQQQAQQLQQQQAQQQTQVYYTPGAPKSALLALDLVRANNTNPTQQPDKLAAKLPLSLPLPLPLQTSISQPQQHSHGPRKTVIQVSVVDYFDLASIIHIVCGKCLHTLQNQQIILSALNL